MREAIDPFVEFAVSPPFSSTDDRPLFWKKLVGLE
jgi:hypothetical protein